MQDFFFKMISERIQYLRELTESTKLINEKFADEVKEVVHKVELMELHLENMRKELTESTTSIDRQIKRTLAVIWTLTLMVILLLLNVILHNV